MLSGCHYNHLNTWRRCIYLLFLMWWGIVNIDLSTISFLFCSRNQGCAKHYIFFLLSSRSRSGGFSLVDCIPCLLVCRCPILVLVYFLICFLMRLAMSPDQVFSKPCLVVLRRLAAVGVKIASWRYCASSSVVVWDRMLIITSYYCYVSKGTSHIPFSFFPVSFIICCTFLTYISCLSIVMVHQ